MTKTLFGCINIVLFGNLYIAAGALFLILSTCIQLSFPINFSYSALVFFATLFVYNLQRSFYSKSEDVSLNSVRRHWIYGHQYTIKLLSLIGLIGTTMSLFFNDLDVVFYLSPLLFISVAYFLPTLKLRKYAWVKLLTLVFVWVITTAIVPILLNHDALLSTKNILHISARFCLMMAICIPFDIRDLSIDREENISTLPQLIGESAARYLSVGFMLCHIVLIAASYQVDFISFKIFIALLVAAIINTFIVVMTHSKRNEYFYVAGIDGTLIIQGVFLIIAEHLF